MMINVGTVETKPLNQVATWLGLYQRCLLNLADLGDLKGDLSTPKVTSLTKEEQFVQR
jgi:hypothetical protein